MAIERMSETERLKAEAEHVNITLIHMSVRIWTPMRGFAPRRESHYLGGIYLPAVPRVGDHIHLDIEGTFREHKVEGVSWFPWKDLLEMRERIELDVSPIK
jgi:hypothetical protein